MRAAATAASRCVACRRPSTSRRSRSARTTAARADGLDGARDRHDRDRSRATRSGGSARCAIAVDEEERDELRVEYEALVGRRVRGRVARRAPSSTIAGRFTAGAPSRAGRRAPARPLGAPARRPRRRRRASRSASTTRVASLDELGGATVVVCIDGYPSGLLGPIEGLIIPTRGQVIATEPIPERYFEVPHYGRHGYDYWHQDEARTDRRRRLPRRLPRLGVHRRRAADRATSSTPSARSSTACVGRELRVDYAWAGIFGMVMDFLPIVGRVPGLDNVWVAGGYSGHGNVLGFACGELVAQAVVGDDAPFLDIFDPARLLNADD